MSTATVEAASVAVARSTPIDDRHRFAGETDRRASQMWPEHAEGSALRLLRLEVGQIEIGRREDADDARRAAGLGGVDAADRAASPVAAHEHRPQPVLRPEVVEERGLPEDELAVVGRVHRPTDVADRVALRPGQEATSTRRPSRAEIRMASVSWTFRRPSSPDGSGSRPSRIARLYAATVRM